MAQDYVQLIQDIAGVVGTTMSVTANVATTASWIMDSSSELDLQAAQIVADAEWDLARDLTVQKVKKVATGNLASGTATLNRPTDLISPEFFYVTLLTSPVREITIVYQGLGYNSPPTWTFANNGAAQSSVNALGQVITSSFLLTSPGNAVNTSTVAVTASAPGSGNTATATASTGVGQKIYLQFKQRGYAENIYNSSNTGQPVYYGVQDATTYFILPSPAENYPYTFGYVYKPTALTMNNLTNIYTDDFYELLRARCLAHAATFMLDFEAKASTVGLWEGRYGNLLRQANGTDTRASRDLSQQPYWAADNRASIPQAPPAQGG